MNTQKRIFSLLLALTLCLGLAVPALAADENSSRHLRMQHLDWTEDGKCYAGEQVLNQEDRGMGGLGYNPFRGDHVIFFVYDDETGTKEFVAPEGSGGIKVEKVDAGAIAPDARYAEYYVCLKMDGWKDGAVTYDGLTFEMPAMYDDFSFYSDQTVSQDNYLGDWDRNVDELPDSRTFYLMNSYSGADTWYHNVVTRAEKTGGDQDDWTLSKVSDGCWKITVNENAFDEKDSLRVEVKVQLKDSDGNTWDEERGITLSHERPSLWFAWPEWTDDDEVKFNPENGVSDFMYVWPGMDEVGMVFGTCETDEDGQPITKTFQPVSPSELEASEGLTLSIENIPYVKGDKNAKYYVTLSTEEFGKEYTVTWEGMSATVSSRLPDLGVYWGEPEVSVDNWAGPYGHAISSVTKEDTFYLIPNVTDEDDGWHVESVALDPDFEMNRYFTLTKGEKDVYTLEIKASESEEDEFPIRLNVTCKGADGNTWNNTYEDSFVTVYRIDDADGNHYSRIMEALLAQPEDGKAVLTLKADFQSNSAAVVLGSSDYGGLFDGETITFPCKDITIDLNGHILRGEKGLPVFEVQDGYSLTIIDSSEGKTGQLITRGETDVVVDEGGKYIPLAAQPVVEEIPASGTALASDQTVLVDGQPVAFQAYALRSEAGDTNYVKLRDVAHVLNGTAAQFEVSYDSAARSIRVTTQTAYTTTGTEMKTPFSGDRTYAGGAKSVTINGTPVDLTAIVLTDDNGGDYTYFKLRDLGLALGFQVDWSAETGICVTTK